MIVNPSGGDWSASSSQMTSAPGPSALTAALSIAGLPTDRFLFAGFLPAKAAARRKALAELLPIAASLVLYEAPQRLAAAVQDIAAADPERQIALCRELTKRYEEVRRADAARLAADLAAEAPPKGEIVLILGPPQRQAQQPSDAEIDARLIALTAEAGVREAAATLAAETGMPRRKLYSRAQALKDGAGS